jgi:hypothetical protein
MLLSYSPFTLYLLLTLKAYSIVLTPGSQIHRKTLKIWAVFANAIVDAMLVHTETLADLESALIKGSRAFADQEPEAAG